MDVLDGLSQKNFSDETLHKIRWVVKMYREWKNYRHSLGIVCDLDDVSTISEESLQFCMCRFITEIKKVNGKDFPGKTLYDIVVCIQFHLECLGFRWKLINDEAFKDLKFTLDNVMKLRTSQGVGVTVRKAEVSTATDEDLLWSLGILGTDMLTDKALIYSGIYNWGRVHFKSW